MLAHMTLYIWLARRLYVSHGIVVVWGSFTKENPKSDLGSKLGFGVLGATLGTVHEINLGERIKNS